jgi:hypothetical protein
MALPRKKVRDARRNAAISRIENRSDRKIAKTEMKLAKKAAKTAKKIEEIEKGEAFGQKLGDSMIRANDKMSSAFSSMFGNNGESAAAAAPPPASPFAALKDPKVLAVIGGGLALAYLASTGELGKLAA